jgi:uncharacterized protein YkwD
MVSHYPHRPLTLIVFASFMAFMGPTVTPAVASMGGQYESDIAAFGNRMRTDRHLVRMTSSSCLDQFAEKQARAMATHRRLFHSALKPILTSCNLYEVGENVAFGYPSGQAVTRAWMHSPEHRENLLNGIHRLIGVGAVQDSRDQWYVAQVLGRTR